MSKYAGGTKVSVERSKVDIQRLLLRYGGDDVVTGESMRHRQAFVQFHYEGLSLEVRISLPDPEQFMYTPSRRRRRRPEDAQQQWGKACRQQWRVLRLLLHAQLEAVENGLMKPWQAFLPWLRLPGGQTVGEQLEGRVSAYLESGSMPKGFLTQGDSE